MDRKRILFVGLDEAEVSNIKQHLDFEYLVVQYDMLPKAKMAEGRLFVESNSVPGKYLAVDKVVFHGIFEDDIDFITLLSLWGGPCLPNAIGMLDLRQRIPGLARALHVSKFGGIKRSMVIGREEWEADKEVVAKWGVWHCGEDKHKFSGAWTSTETSVIEDFIEGEAVRIMIINDRHWQIRLTGDSWLKSIHNSGSWEMDVDSDLLEDSKNISRHFGLQIVGVDYMVGHNGQKYLLEVNHIPNVTVFPFMNEVFVDYVVKWILS